MSNILERLKGDYPEHEFSIDDNVVNVDGDKTSITWTEVDNLLEDRAEDRKVAEDALYEVLKIKIGEFLRS